MRTEVLDDDEPPSIPPSPAPPRPQPAAFTSFSEPRVRTEVLDEVEEYAADDDGGADLDDLLYGSGNPFLPRGRAAPEPLPKLAPVPAPPPTRVEVLAADEDAEPLPALVRPPAPSPPPVVLPKLVPAPFTAAPVELLDEVDEFADEGYGGDGFDDDGDDYLATLLPDGDGEAATAGR